MIDAAQQLVADFITEDATFVPGDGVEQVAQYLHDLQSSSGTTCQASPGEIKYELKRRLDAGWLVKVNRKEKIDGKASTVRGISTLSLNAQVKLAETIAARTPQPKKRNVRTRVRTAGTVVPAQ